jgi:general stress protein YciG
MARNSGDQAIRNYLAEIGRKGGQAKVPKGIAVLSDEERKKRAQQAAAARWGGKKKAAKRGSPPKKQMK